MILQVITRRWTEPGLFGEQCHHAVGVYRHRRLHAKFGPQDLILVTPEHDLAANVCAAPDRPLDLGLERREPDWRPC